MTEDTLTKHVLELLNLNYDSYLENKDKRLSEITDNVVREKIMVLRNYYNFLNDKPSIKFVQDVHDLIINSNEIKINKFIDPIELSIIILKSFLAKKNLVDTNFTFVNSYDIFNNINNYLFSYLISQKKYMHQRYINNLTILLLELLVHNQIINKKDVHFSKNESINDWEDCVEDIDQKIRKGRKLKYYIINTERYSINVNKPIYEYFNFSWVGYEWTEINDQYYITGVHYSKTHKVNKKNIYSNKSFKIKNKKYVIGKINLPVYVDNKYQNNLKQFIEDDNKITEKIKSLNETIKLLFDKKLWTVETNKELANTQQEISTLTNKLVNKEFANYDFGENSIIFPLYMDFRGRKYYYSMISPTNSRLLRLSYYYGYYKDEDFVIPQHRYSSHFDDMIDEFCEIYEINKDIKFREAIFWCLIGIGKHFRNKNKYPISAKEFLELGINYYNNHDKILDLDKKMEILHYETIMKSLYDSKIKKRAIMKDATASINQIFMKILGPLNQNSLNYVNLGNSNLWYDTYLVQREKFYEYLLVHNPNNKYTDKTLFNKCFPRDLIKNMLMIIPYSAGIPKCWENYVNAVELEKKDINVDDKELKLTFKLFYKYIKEIMQEKHLYLKSSKELIQKINEDFIEESEYVLESEGGDADISYMKMKRSTVDVKYISNGESKRATKLIMIPSGAIDITKFQKSSGANTAHFYDAEEIRIIEQELGYHIITIHDCYLIDFINCSKLIDVKLEHYRKSINKGRKKYEINNIFVML